MKPIPKLIATIEDARRNLYIVIGVALAVAGTLGILTFRRIVHPIRALEGSVTSIAGGDYEQAAALLDLTARSLGQDCLRLAPVLAQLVETELRRGDLTAARGAAERLLSAIGKCSQEVAKKITLLIHF